jgi:DNA-binding NarL/FixJ family response regulator
MAERTIVEACPATRRLLEKGASVLVIESRAFAREAFVETLRKNLRHTRLIALESAEDITENASFGLGDVAIVIISITSLSRAFVYVSEALSRIRRVLSDIPTVLIVDNLNRADASVAFDLGFKGCIPTTANATIIVNVLRLISAGADYAPPNILMGKSPEQPKPVTRAPTPPLTFKISSPFSPRQKEVLLRLVEGKSNKVIAYELNMKESTAKVHVRQIIRKLGVVNRTQAALVGERMLRGLQP